jgi:hypothetical protein
MRDSELSSRRFDQSSFKSVALVDTQTPGKRSTASGSRL